MENQINPYATPKSNTVVAEQILEPVPASKGARFLNLIIDYIMQVVVIIVFTAIALAVGGDKAMGTLDDIPDLLLGIVAMFSYYIVMEAAFGRTVGKLVTGTKVVNKEGQKASFKQILGRTFARIIPFEAFTFLGSQGRGLHDEMPKTYVVKCR
jgi:uncharacterized RDD family membrane protein YckC